jgi:LuxR family maltose regulon positive regulatory protein
MSFGQNRYRWDVAMARIHEAHGDLDGALDLLEHEEPVFMTDLSPNVRPIAAMKARLLVRQGRLDEALAWAREQEITEADDLSYLREFEHITLARLVLARGSSDEALRLLGRLLRAAEDGDRTGSVIEILVLQALAHQQRRDSEAALVPLERALTLAEPEDFVRIFVDEGAPMATLLEAAAKRRIAPRYVQRLLAAFGSRASAQPVSQTLPEPLSERELDVLRLLGTDLDGPEIASELMVSLNTMRTHTKSIYSKLGVNNRRAAVRRAEELELLSRTPTR